MLFSEVVLSCFSVNFSSSVLKRMAGFLEISKKSFSNFSLPYYSLKVEMIVLKFLNFLNSL